VAARHSEATDDYNCEDCERRMPIASNWKVSYSPHWIIVLVAQPPGRCAYDRINRYRPSLPLLATGIEQRLCGTTTTSRNGASWPIALGRISRAYRAVC